MSEFNGAAKPSSQTIFRIAQEVSSVAASSSLPCSLSSSVFVRSDDGKMTLLKAIITGPTETPYTGGVYEFDIYFPNGYPRCPPKVKFRTTGAGSVRFNPNLYNEGKVCLSLLGTWGGAKGEEWNGDTSTIIQVLSGPIFIRKGRKICCFRFWYQFRALFSYLNPTTMNLAMKEITAPQRVRHL